MSYTYIGGTDEFSPITPPSSASFSSTMSPEAMAIYQKQEDDRKAAEEAVRAKTSTEGLVWARRPGTATWEWMDPQELYMGGMMAGSSALGGGAQNLSSAMRAIQAAHQFQEQRGYQNDLEAGMTEAEARARHPGMWLGGAGFDSLIRPRTYNTGQGEMVQTGLRPGVTVLRPRRTYQTEVVQRNGRNYLDITQPNGTFLTKELPEADADSTIEVKDFEGQPHLVVTNGKTGAITTHQINEILPREQKALESELAAARKKLDTAQSQLEATSVTVPSVTPAQPERLGGLLKATPAVTNQIPAYPNPNEVAQAKANYIGQQKVVADLEAKLATMTAARTRSAVSVPTNLLSSPQSVTNAGVTPPPIPVTNAAPTVTNPPPVVTNRPLPVVTNPPPVAGTNAPAEKKAPPFEVVRRFYLQTGGDRKKTKELLRKAGYSDDF